MKTVKERDDLDLLELVCELHARSVMYINKDTHDASVEARQELESRLKNRALNSELKYTEADLSEFAEWTSKNGWKCNDTDGLWWNYNAPMVIQKTSQLLLYWEITTGRKQQVSKADLPSEDEMKKAYYSAPKEHMNIYAQAWACVIAVTTGRRPKTCECKNSSWNDDAGCFVCDNCGKNI